MFLVWVGKSKTCVLEISLSSFTCGLHEIKRGCGGGDVFMGRGQNNSNLTFTIKTGWVTAGDYSEFKKIGRYLHKKKKYNEWTLIFSNLLCLYGCSSLSPLTRSTSPLLCQCRTSPQTPDIKLLQNTGTINQSQWIVWMYLAMEEEEAFSDLFISFFHNSLKDAHKWYSCTYTQ